MAEACAQTADFNMVYDPITKITFVLYQHWSRNHLRSCTSCESIRPLWCDYHDHNARVKYNLGGICVGRIHGVGANLGLAWFVLALASPPEMLTTPSNSTTSNHPDVSITVVFINPSAIHPSAEACIPNFGWTKNTTYEYFSQLPQDSLQSLEIVKGSTIEMLNRYQSSHSDCVTQFERDRTTKYLIDFVYMRLHVQTSEDRCSIDHTVKQGNFQCHLEERPREWWNLSQSYQNGPWMERVYGIEKQQRSIP